VSAKQGRLLYLIARSLRARHIVEFGTSFGISTTYPGLRGGAAVLADNIFTFWHALASYVAYVQDPLHGFCSVTLFLGDGMEYSVRL
jgi:hypothetical protein